MMAIFEGAATTATAQHRRQSSSFDAASQLGCPALEVEFAHIRTAANAGTGLRPHDQFGVPLCHNHHREQHQVGQGTFEDRHGIDLDAIAAELVRRSPDMQMRLAMMLAEEG